MGVALYTAAWVLRGILGLAPGATILGVDALMFFIIVLGVLTGIYTMVGGLLAVVWTESVQTVLLLVGAVVITVVGYLKVGGWSALAQTLATHPHPLAGVAGSKVTWGTAQLPAHGAQRRAIPPACRGIPSCSATRCSASGTGAATRRSCSACWRRRTRSTPASARCSARSSRSGRCSSSCCPASSAWRWCSRARSAARRPQTAADTYTFLITHLLPVGLKGLVAAAMLAAAMQTCSAALNSTATLVAYDICSSAGDPRPRDHQLVRHRQDHHRRRPRSSPSCCSPLFGHYTTIFEGINKLISYVAPPITAVFLLGVFWKTAVGQVRVHHAGRRRAMGAGASAWISSRPVVGVGHAESIAARRY